MTELNESTCTQEIGAENGVKLGVEGRPNVLIPLEEKPR
jgi:hypothetical protein